MSTAANLGGVADPRLGDEADAIGTSHDVVPGDVAPPDPHGHNTIYLDSSITFENYHYWANRSRAFEKHISTNDKGLQQIWNMVLGKKNPNQPYISDLEVKAPAGERTNNEAPVPADVDEKNISNDGVNGGSIEKSKWSHGVSESEWEMAQRATRTATWGG